MIDKIYKKNENEVYIIFDNEKLPFKIETDDYTAVELVFYMLDDLTDEVPIEAQLSKVS